MTDYITIKDVIRSLQFLDRKDKAIYNLAEIDNSTKKDRINRRIFNRRCKKGDVTSEEENFARCSAPGYYEDVKKQKEIAEKNVERFSLSEIEECEKTLQKVGIKRYMKGKKGLLTFPEKQKDGTDTMRYYDYELPDGKSRKGAALAVGGGVAALILSIFGASYIQNAYNDMLKNPNPVDEIKNACKKGPTKEQALTNSGEFVPGEGCYVKEYKQSDGANLTDMYNYLEEHKLPASDIIKAWNNPNGTLQGDVMLTVADTQGLGGVAIVKGSEGGSIGFDMPDGTLDAIIKYTLDHGQYKYTSSVPELSAAPVALVSIPLIGYFIRKKKKSKV